MICKHPKHFTCKKKADKYAEQYNGNVKAVRCFNRRNLYHLVPSVPEVKK